MIYTIGHEQNYLGAIENSEYGVIHKLGKWPVCDQFPEGYEGGYAFETFDDAQRRIDEKYSAEGFGVFGLDAIWGVDTEPNQNGEWWHNLLNDAEIIVITTKK